MKLAKRVKKSSTLNITSLIDVMFILLLFFIVTSTFKEINNAALDIVLPKANQGKEVEEKEDEITLFLAKNNQISLLDEQMPLDSFDLKFHRYKEKIGDKTILLKGDENVTYQSFIEVFDILKKHNIEKLILLSKKKN